MVADAVVAPARRRRGALWALRENISEAQKREGASIKHDISVPVSAIAEFIAAADAALRRRIPGVRIVAFGHLGDGNLHYNLASPARRDDGAFLARSDARQPHRARHRRRCGGSISAEHGIGQLKRDELARYKSAVSSS